MKRSYNSSSATLLLLSFLSSFLNLSNHCSAQTHPLEISFKHLFNKRHLELHSLRYKNGSAESLSVTRSSFLISNISLQSNTKEWIHLKENYGWIDIGKENTSVTINNVPKGIYKKIKLTLGLDEKTNHSNPAQYAPNHPLNPVRNQLHWNWKEGYIFFALEGLYKYTNNKTKGFSYHFANDWNLTELEFDLYLNHKSGHILEFSIDLKNIFDGQEVISIRNDGNSTHSAKEDLIAQKIKSNLSTAIQLENIRKRPEKIIKPIVEAFDLPQESTPYSLSISPYFPKPDLPSDNPLIAERIELGKKLFHDPLLSKDQTVSCASCHKQENAFSDDRKFSKGVNNQIGIRHSMPLFNLAWKKQFFWDGRSKSLREQVIHPLTDPIEMGESIPNIIKKLDSSNSYKKLFSQAYDSGEISEKSLTLALESFLLTLTSDNSKFDQSLSKNAELSELEQEGLQLFMTEHEPRSGKMGADCFHCHGGALFTNQDFHNNGLFDENDLGVGNVTKKPEDEGKFSSPSLRNLSFTAPYMHDGRFASIEEVIDHYNSGISHKKNLDPNLAKHPEEGLKLSDRQKKALVAFLKTLDDPKFLKFK